MNTDLQLNTSDWHHNKHLLILTKTTRDWILAKTTRELKTYGGWLTFTDVAALYAVIGRLHRSLGATVAMATVIVATVKRSWIHRCTFTSLCLHRRQQVQPWRWTTVTVGDVSSSSLPLFSVRFLSDIVPIASYSTGSHTCNVITNVWIIMHVTVLILSLSPEVQLPIVTVIFSSSFLSSSLFSHYVLYLLGIWYLCQFFIFHSFHMWMSKSKQSVNI